MQSLMAATSPVGSLLPLGKSNGASVLLNLWSHCELRPQPGIYMYSSTILAWPNMFQSVWLVKRLAPKQTSEHCGGGN